MADFANYPVSLAERKAETSGKARDWSPRDALIAVLRDIDAGKKVDAVVICYREIDGDERNTHFSMSSPDCLTGLGLLSRVAHMINEAG
jgi:hypothetical protein